MAKSYKLPTPASILDAGADALKSLGSRAPVGRIPVNAPSLPPRAEPLGDPRPSMEKHEDAIKRLSISYSALTGTSTYNPGTNMFAAFTVPVAGDTLWLPRGENFQDRECFIVPAGLVNDPNFAAGNIAAANVAAKALGYLKVGGRYHSPFKANDIALLFYTSGLSLTLPAQWVNPIVYVTSSEARAFIDSGNDSSHLNPPAAFIDAFTSVVSGSWQNVIDTGVNGGTNRPWYPGGGGGDIWTQVPQTAMTQAANSNANGSGFLIDRLDRLTLGVWDGNATSCATAGTLTIRPWWWIPNVIKGAAVTLQLAEAASAAVGWLPDANVFTVSNFNRVFSMQMNVRPGFTPSYFYGYNPYSFDQRGQPANDTISQLRGAALTFQLSGIPAGSRPQLVMTGEWLP